MAGINKVILVGHLGRDPELRYTPGGQAVANFTLATTETFTKRDGARDERTEWHRVAIYSEPLVRVAEQYLKKGSKIYLEGQLETRKWQDQSGQDRYTTEIALRPYRSELTMLDGRDGGGGGGGSYGGASGGGYGDDRGGGYPDDRGQGGGGGRGGADVDDEIPF